MSDVSRRCKGKTPFRMQRLYAFFRHPLFLHRLRRILCCLLSPPFYFVFIVYDFRPGNLSIHPAAGYSIIIYCCCRFRTAQHLFRRVYRLVVTLIYPAPVGLLIRDPVHPHRMSRAAVIMFMVSSYRIAARILAMYMILRNRIAPSLYRTGFHMRIFPRSIRMIVIMICDRTRNFLHTDNQLLRNPQNSILQFCKCRIIICRNPFCEQCGCQTGLAITHRCKNLIQILFQCLIQLTHIRLECPCPLA